MKYAIFPIAAVTALAASLAACSDDKKPSEPKLEFEKIYIEVNDSASYLSVEYPVDGPQPLTDSIRIWMISVMPGYDDPIDDEPHEPNYSYKGDIGDIRALKNYYVKLFDDEYAHPLYGEMSITDISLAEDTEPYLTFDLDAYWFGGGAHGIGDNYGATFLRGNGTRFSLACFDDHDRLLEIINRYLMNDYFEVATKAEYKQMLLTCDEETGLAPLPTVDPWIENDTISFYYSSYEIAPYSAGHPTARIPVDSISSLLNSAGRHFLPK